MSEVQLNIDYDYFEKECDYSDLKLATDKLCTASESQFEQIKKEKWYTRIFDMITFSKKNEKRLASNITNLAQSQQVLVELLIRLSARDTRITELVEESFNKIEKLSNSSVQIAEAVKVLRDRCILGLVKSNDIGDLSDINKEILARIMSVASERFDVLNEDQQKYNDSILRYINVKEPQNIELSKALKEITDNRVKKKMLVCIMELAFLHNLNFDFISSDFADFIQEFDFGEKTIREIRENIQKSYKLRGKEGFYNKYGYMDYDNEIDDTFTVTLEDSDNINDTAIKRDIDDILPPELEIYKIDNILKIKKDETLKIKNKDVRLNNHIECLGVIEFINCKITAYKTIEGLKGQIKMSEYRQDNPNCCISFVNCFISCEVYSLSKSLRYNPNNWLINNNHNGCINSIKIINCQIINFNKFLESPINELLIRNSYIENPEGEFIKAGMREDYKNYKNVCIENTEIHFKEGFDTTSWGAIFDFYSYSDSLPKTALIRNCIFISESNDLKRRSFSTIELFSRSINVEHCDFNNLDISFGYCKSIKDSFFLSCTILNIKYTEEIINCLFVGNSGNIVEIQKTQLIKGCKFINNTTGDRYIRDLIYIDLTNPLLLSFDTINIENCIFNGIYLNKDCYIINSEVNEGTNKIAVVKACIFKNCKTENNAQSIIKDYVEFSIKKRKELKKAIDIVDCEGFNSINKQVEEVVFDGNKEIGNGVISGISKKYACYGLPQKWIDEFNKYRKIDNLSDNEKGKNELLRGIDRKVLTKNNEVKPQGIESIKNKKDYNDTQIEELAKLIISIAKKYSIGWKYHYNDINNSISKEMLKNTFTYILHKGEKNFIYSSNMKLPNSSTEKIVVIIDTSITEKCKEGFVFTTEGFYLSGDNSPTYCKYDKVTNVEYKKKTSFLSFDKTMIATNNYVIEYEGTVINKNKLAYLLEEVIKLFK